MKKKKFRLSVAGNVYVKNLYNILIVCCFVETPHCDVSTTIFHSKISHLFCYFLSPPKEMNRIEYGFCKIKVDNSEILVTRNISFVSS